GLWCLRSSVSRDPRSDTRDPRRLYYRSTFSSIHSSPDVSVIGRNRCLAVTAICMRDSSGEIVCRGLLNDVTRKEAPTGVPDVPSKRRPHTLNNPSRFETKYSVFPPGPQCGLSSYASPSVMGVQR